MYNELSKSKTEKLYTLTGLMVYCNKNFGVKKTGTKFTEQDIQQYIQRGHLPKYTGGRLIIRVKNAVEGRNVYKLSPPCENTDKMMRMLKGKSL